MSTRAPKSVARNTLSTRWRTLAHFERDLSQGDENRNEVSLAETASRSWLVETFLIGAIHCVSQAPNGT